MKTKIKTRRYVTELMDVFWVAGLGPVFEEKEGSEVFERSEFSFFNAFVLVIKFFLHWQIL